MIFCWNPSDSRSVQVSRTFISIHNSAVVRMFSILSLIFTSASSPGPWWLSQRPWQEIVSPLSSCSTDFSALWQDPSICLSSCFHSFLFWSTGMAKSTKCQVFFFVLFNWSLRDRKSLQFSKTLPSILADLML